MTDASRLVCHTNVGIRHRVLSRFDVDLDALEDVECESPTDVANNDGI